jgi:hypothetical protein
MLAADLATSEEAGGRHAIPSMMDMTVEVTPYSNDSLDKSLFEISSSYTQVQQDPDAMFGAGANKTTAAATSRGPTAP